MGRIKTDRKPPGCENRMWRFLQKPVLHILLITAVGLLAYSNTFNVPFHFDDEYIIVKNPIIKDLNYFVEPSKAKVLKGRFPYETFKCAARLLAGITHPKGAVF
jgi:hypothetical protein